MGQVVGADWGCGEDRHEEVIGHALGTSAGTTGPGAPQTQDAPQRPTHSPVSEARDEARPRVGQQETAALPGLRAQPGYSRLWAETPRTRLRARGCERRARASTEPHTGGS